MVYRSTEINMKRRIEMRKKLRMLGLVMGMVLVVGGCSSTSKDDIASKEEKSSTTDEHVTSETLDVEYARLIPNPKEVFSDCEVSIIDADGGKQYAFRVENYKEGEYEKYIEQCKSMGFDNVHYEGENDGGKMYFAYTPEKDYYLQITYGYDIEAIDVICKTVN